MKQSVQRNTPKTLWASVEMMDEKIQTGSVLGDRYSSPSILASKTYPNCYNSIEYAYGLGNQYAPYSNAPKASN